MEMAAEQGSKALAGTGTDACKAKGLGGVLPGHAPPGKLER